MLVEQRHQDCENTECKICLEDADRLGDFLEDAVGDICDDHLGEYYNWLKENNIGPENAHGWFSAEAFDDININAFIAGGTPLAAPENIFIRANHVGTYLEFAIKSGQRVVLDVGRLAAKSIGKEKEILQQWCADRQAERAVS